MASIIERTGAPGTAYMVRLPPAGRRSRRTRKACRSTAPDQCRTHDGPIFHHAPLHRVHSPGRRPGRPRQRQS